MKIKRSLLVFVTAAFSYIIFSSYSTGTAIAPHGLNLTGAGGSSNNCAGGGCHDPNTSDLSLSIYLTDVAAGGDTVKNGKYFPGNFYIVKLYGVLSSFSTTYPEFSFQFTSERANGMFGGDYAPTPDLMANPAGGFEVVEPKYPLPPTVNNRFSKSIYWIAPPAGAGNVSLYVTMLASNGNGFATGDKANNKKETFAPETLSAFGLEDEIKTKIFPNPVKDQLYLSISHAEKANYTMLIHSPAGQVMTNDQFSVTDKDFKTSISTAAWPAGTYFLQILNGDKRRILPFVKQ